VLRAGGREFLLGWLAADYVVETLARIIVAFMVINIHRYGGLIVSEFLSPVCDAWFSADPDLHGIKIDFGILVLLKTESEDMLAAMDDVPRGGVFPSELAADIVESGHGMRNRSYHGMVKGARGT